MIRDDDRELAASIEAGYVRMGCPPDQAKTLVEEGYAAHYRIEEQRREIVTGAVIPDEVRINFMLLVMQLEITHLQVVLQNMLEHVGAAGDVPDGATVQ